MGTGVTSGPGESSRAQGEKKENAWRYGIKKSQTNKEISNENTKSNLNNNKSVGKKVIQETR